MRWHLLQPNFSNRKGKSEWMIEYSIFDYLTMLTNIWLVQTVLIFTVKQYRKGCADLKIPWHTLHFRALGR